MAWSALTRTFVAIGVLNASSAVLATETITYTYDALGRLTKVSHVGSVNNGLQASYALDAAGNRTGTTTSGVKPVPIVVPLRGLSVIQIIRK